MQYQPSAAELLAAIAELLEDDLLPAVPDALKHRTRVAANLARILEREEALGPDAARRERERLAALVGGGGGADGDDAVRLALELARRVRADDDPGFQADAWEALVAICRDDLAIAKPGHDAWEGQ
ncbi:MAG TPA: DUF6285 domain-containing protein [Acidimicrobiales bacterium]|nr:DUF6285 domain-containing protein [Acidimicrobiales bacterium]